MCSRLISFCSALLVTCFFILSSGTFQIDVSADSYPVALTAAQSLALFGNKIQAKYFNGTSVEFIDFDFWATTSQMVTSVEDTFESGTLLSPYVNKNLFGLSLANWSCAVDAVNTPADWFTGGNSGTVSTKQDFSVYDFLIYRWQGAPSTVKDNVAPYFQFNIQQSVTLSNVDRFRFACGWSSNTCNDLDSGARYTYAKYRSQYDLYANNDIINPIYTTTNCKRSGSNYFNCSFLPMYNAGRLASNAPNNLDTLNMYLTPCPVISLMAIDTDTFQTPVNLTSHIINIRNAQGVISRTSTYNEPDEFTPPYVYLILMCPVVWGDITPPEPEQTTPNYSDQIQNIEVGVGDININLDETNNRLDLILAKLDDIYENMGVSVEGVDLTEQGPLSWIGTHIDNLGTSIVNGVRGLFIPSQADLINFRLNLQSDFQTHFPAFFTADDKVHNLYSIFENSVTPRSSITVPTVSMTVSDVANNQNANFSFGGYEVPLKPNQDRLGILYDSLAFIIDAIATLGIINMLRSKIRKIFSGGNTD